ncbi:putative ABC transporter permease [Dethiothermospora halolimnae]|uniref:putative ABC transporter permease n=1 Tax=Dethiothermospora halolimnae TaxID=3114390 RepID=UPI003CCC44DE
MFNTQILGFSLYNIVYYFLVYSFLGWCLETTYVTYIDGKFTNRGFLNGPFCPIYGFGATLIIVLLNPIDNVIILFIAAIILTTILEYITGYVLEKLFNTVWWDYSERFLNIKGRVCLYFSLIWGFLSLFLIVIIHPITKNFLRLIPTSYGSIFIYIISLYFLIDLSITITSIVELNLKLKKLNVLSNEIKTKLHHLKDVTDDKEESIEAKIKELRRRYNNVISKRINLHARLIKAFPNIRSNKFNHILKDVKKHIERLYK